jgi:membrane protein
MPVTELKEYVRKRLEHIRERAKKISLPIFEDVPLYDVGLFFWKGIENGSITTRASAIAFNIILAIFPAIIFIFTLIPYVPIENFQSELLGLIESIVPQNAFEAISSTVEDIVTQPHGGLLSFGFFFALIFATNGVDSLISAFNATVHEMDTRSWWNQRVVSLALVIILTLLMTVGIILMTLGQLALNFLVDKHILVKDFTYYLLLVGKWVVICALFFFTYAFLFYYAPAKKSKFRFISAGVSLAAILSLITSLGFSFYINNFGRYNKLYGSIGTLLVVMIWIYFNAVILLVGFELNVSIANARKNNKKFSAGEIDEFSNLDLK